MKKTKFLAYLLMILLVTSVDINSQELIDSEDEDKTDFASPGGNKEDEGKDDLCETSPHSELLNLLNVKLKKFNPIPEDRRGGEVRGGGNQLTPDEISTNSIRFYAEQLKDLLATKHTLQQQSNHEPANSVIEQYFMSDSNASNLT